MAGDNAVIAASNTLDLGKGMNLPIPIASVIIGLIVLFFGRKLFWLCVAAVGFAAGVEIAPHLFHEPTTVMALTIAVVLGFVGALLALFLQKFAIAVAGFLAGGKLALALAGAFLVQLSNYPIITFIVGGIIGAIVLLSLFDWALIFLSAIVGAYLILNAVTLPPVGRGILFVILAAIGVFAQTAALRKSRSPVA